MYVRYKAALALDVTSMASLSHAASGAELHLCQSSLLPSTCYISGKVDTTSDLVLFLSQIPNHNLFENGLLSVSLP